MQRGFDHRLLPPYRVIRSPDVENDAEGETDIMEMGHHGDADLEQGRSPSHGISSMQAHLVGPLQDGDRPMNISTDQNYKQDDDDDPPNLPSGPAIIIPLRDETPREDDEEWLLSGPKLTGRASTFPRVPFGRAFSP